MSPQINVNRMSESEILAVAQKARAEAFAAIGNLVVRKLSSAFARIAAPVRAWWDQQRLSESLMGMTDRELADMGLSRGDIASVVEGRYRDPSGQRTPSQPIAIRINPGLPQAPANQQDQAPAQKAA